ADGSVRDGLSLLDQAIALGGDHIDESRVRDMLGLADRLVVFDLFEAILRGRLDDALARLGEMYKAGADPAVVIEDLLTLTHWLVRVKLAPEAAQRPDVPEAEAKRGKALAAAASMALLTRAWQILLKGLRETQNAPQPVQAAEMVLVRLAYAADLPDPAELVRRIEADGAAASAGNGGASAPRGPRAEAMPAARPVSGSRLAAQPAPDAAPDAAPRAAPRTAPRAARAAAEPAAELSPMPATFAALADLVEAKREAILHANLFNNVHLVRYEPGALEFRPEPQAPKNLAGQLQSLLAEWTGRRWMVSVSNQEGEPTLRQRQHSQAQRLRRETAEHPLVKAVKDVFPDARIVAVRERGQPEPPTGIRAAGNEDGEGEPD
ncbi:MAG: DNA polymerase III subunit gamma/tau, partial [Rhodospirillales bacterium]